MVEENIEDCESVNYVEKSAIGNYAFEFDSVNIAIE